MNERIKQFADEAAKFSAIMALPTGESGDKLFVEKFAELIVRECAAIAKTKSDFIAEQAMKYAEDTDEETSAKSTAWQFLVFGQEIKQHFGVEE